jgi:hypothetical protein|tara:strand:- start:3553 stop:3741 length:189 start_codon:yes stop_codon:yes gene_type:complete
MPAVQIDTELVSWWLFLACAIGFTTMAIRERDLLFPVSTLFPGPPASCTPSDVAATERSVTG